MNISTRETVGTGDDVLIGGFIVSGTTPKQVILRAIGPSLAAFGLTGLLQDPTLEVHDASGATIFMNDNWRDTQEAAIEATGIPPNDDRESAIVATLDPGAYTAIIQGKNNTTGTALVEAYDLDALPVSRFGNISTRGLVGTFTNVLIGGLIVSSEESAQANVIVRALGPSLGNAGVAGALCRIRRSSCTTATARSSRRMTTGATPREESSARPASRRAMTARRPFSRRCPPGPTPPWSRAKTPRRAWGWWKPTTSRKCARP